MYDKVCQKKGGATRRRFQVIHKKPHEGVFKHLPPAGRGLNKPLLFIRPWEQPAAVNAQIIYLLKFIIQVSFRLCDVVLELTKHTVSQDGRSDNYDKK